MSTNVEMPEADPLEAASVRAGPSLMQIAWQRKSLVILGIMLGLVLGLLYYAQKQPVYQSKSQMLVVKKTPTSSLRLGSGEEHIAYMEDYMSTQSILVRSPVIIERAVKKPSLQDLKSFAGERPENIVYLIQDQLNVLRDKSENQSGSSNNILTLQFRGPDADEAREILIAVMDSYQSFLDETYKTVSDNTLNLILEAKGALTSNLQQAEQAYREFRIKNPFLLWKSSDGGGSNIYQVRLANVEKKREEVKVRKMELEEKLASLKRVLKESGEAAAMSQIAMTGLKLPMSEVVNDVQKEIMKLETQKRQLSQLGYGARHPAMQGLDDQIQQWKSMYSQPASGPESTGPGKVRTLNSAESYIIAMESSISEDEALIKKLDDMFEADQKSAKELSTYDFEDERLRNNITQGRQLVDSIVKRLNELNLVKDFGGFEARRIAPASFGKKVSPNPFTVFPVAAFGGLLAGLCLAYLAEISDKSFRTPAEIRRRLGLPVIGHIPFFVPDETAQKQLAAGEPCVDPMLCAHYASNSVSAEAYRSVRTAIYFNTQGVGHQVIQVTSPNMADGKSTLAANLAVSMAQSGKKTILVDADCRRPRAHKILNVANDTGLASVIAGQSDLATAIRPTAVPNLAVLPCGPRPANPAELLTSPRFKELLDIIRAQYDYILVDTPPLLVVTDPCVVAPRVDGVLLAIRVTKNGRPFAERAKEILTSLGANVIGVVVNGLGGQAGGRYGYGYDSYNYGYGYGYTYRYSYTYTDGYSEDKASSYYSAPDNPEMPPSPPSPSGMNGDAIAHEVAEPPPAPEAPAFVAPTVNGEEEESFPAS